MRAGFIGLGHIGRGIARELVRAGHSTTVYDVVPDGPDELAALGASVAGSPREVAEAADHIGICVRTDQEVIDVVEGTDGILAGARPGTLVTIHSTIRPSTVHRVAATTNARGVRIVDAPVSRGSMAPEGKIIVFMLGGAPADIEDARAFVEPSAKDIIVAGGLGAAMALKICNNLVTYTEFMAAYEAWRLAGRAGLDPALLLSVMTANGNASPAMQGLMRNWSGQRGELAGPALAHARQFTAIGEKDLDCALEVAREVDLDLPGAALVRGRLEEIMFGRDVEPAMERETI